MTDHHDFADHHDDLGHDPASHDDLPIYEHDAPAQPDDHYAWDDDGTPHEVHDDSGGHPDDVPQQEFDHHGAEPVADDAQQPHVLPEDDGASLVDPFPPQVDVGDLPEPVDGFPWIDPDALGAADPAALHAALAQVDPHELAEYAGIDLPPGADPWQALAASDDPATAALARFWAEN